MALLSNFNPAKPVTPTATAAPAQPSRFNFESSMTDFMAGLKSLGSAPGAAPTLGQQAASAQSMAGQAYRAPALTQDELNNMSSAYRANQLMESGSPLLQQAQNRASSQGNARGLLNSTANINAGTQAMLAEAGRYGAADAANYTTAWQTDRAADARAREQFAGAAFSEGDFRRQDEADYRNLTMGLAAKNYENVTERDFTRERDATQNEFQLGRDRAGNEFTTGRDATLNTYAEQRAAEDARLQLQRDATQNQFTLGRDTLQNQFQVGRDTANNQFTLGRDATQNAFTMTRDERAAVLQKERDAEAAALQIRRDEAANEFAMRRDIVQAELISARDAVQNAFTLGRDATQAEQLRLRDAEAAALQLQRDETQNQFTREQTTAQNEFQLTRDQTQAQLTRDLAAEQNRLQIERDAAANEFTKIRDATLNAYAGERETAAADAIAARDAAQAGLLLTRDAAAVAAQIARDSTQNAFTTVRDINQIAADRTSAATLAQTNRDFQLAGAANQTARDALQRQWDIDDAELKATQIEEDEIADRREAAYTNYQTTVGSIISGLASTINAIQAANLEPDIKAQQIWSAQVVARGQVQMHNTLFANHKDWQSDWKQMDIEVGDAPVAPPAAAPVAAPPPAPTVAAPATAAPAPVTNNDVTAYMLGNGMLDANGHIVAGKERSIYDAAKQFGLSAAQFDSAMGWPTGNTAAWIAAQGWDPL